VYRSAVIDPYRYLRPLLFALPPEMAHAVTLDGLQLAHRIGLLPLLVPHTNSTPLTLMGLRFPNRLGIAAGLDKNVTCIDALGALGFGFIEVGTITPQPQPGNARPRLFRSLSDHALINRMGFPNDGTQAVCERLSKRRYHGIRGVSIGKNATTPLSDAAADYVACLAAVYPYADYVAINISSPNTAELRRLQQGELLRSLLSTLVASRVALTREHERHVPLLIKLTADLDDVELADAARVAVACGIDGIIATNTTVRRDGLKHSSGRSSGPSSGREAGGLSGAPLFARALQAVRCIRAEVGSEFPLIGVGGIASAENAVAMRAAGADLLQIYTGLIYRGPALIGEILASRANT